MARQVLGRGLDALIQGGVHRGTSPITLPASIATQSGETVKLETQPPVAGNNGNGSHNSVMQIAIEQIQPNPFQPRDSFAEEALQELAQSIAQRGIVQPLLVRKTSNNHFELIAGERRWRAAKAAGLTSVPVIVHEATDQEALEIALIENLQREDLNPIEEALAFEQLATQFNLTQDQIAEKVGKSRAAVANSMRLLALPNDLRAWVAKNMLSVGHAKVILGLSSSDQQAYVAGEVLRRNLTVRETEKIVERIKTARSGVRGAKSSVKQPEYAAVEEALQQKLGTRVHIHPRKKGGSIEIEYYSIDDLDRLVELLGVTML